MALRPFRIEFTHRAIDDLRARLDLARWPSPLAGEEAFDGALRLLARDWAAFDWTPWQTRLNALSHLRGVVEGGEVHTAVLGVPWTQRRATVLLLHDAAGTFFDRLPLADRLRAAGNDVVLASLPGTGYSERLTAAATPEAAARRIHAAMQVLGYTSYAVHGDGYGGTVAKALAAASEGAATDLGLGRAAEGAPLPPASAYALHDSPLGVLAWRLAATGMPGEADRDLWLAATTWCWLTGTASYAATLAGGRVRPASDEAVVEAVSASAG
ncbi:MAG: microsomal epoxide hydrolase [Chloroflexota bacterium]